MILQCQNLDKTYKQGSLDVPVLHHIQFSMEAGEYVAVMGPSGSGKSTLMNLIGCLDTPTGGTLILDGKDVGHCSEDELASIRLDKIGFVFQTFQLMSYMTARENVELPLIYAGVKKEQRRKQADEALAKVGLSDRADFLPNQLSGGQKQRVAIARAIINHPAILLADEPTGALDSVSGEQVMDLFTSLNKEGMTVLMITHDAHIAKYASRVVYIRDGKLQEGDFA